jgi:hypothetical protein
LEVVAEFGSVAERLSDGGVRVEGPELLGRVARAQRSVQGLPIWSSYAMVGLTREGSVGCLELHWPSLTPALLKEGQLLQALLTEGFKAPELPGAQVESVEAGVLHSPAIAYFMDAVPAIRAIYRGDDKSVGRKPILHLDRHGEPVTLPRTLHLAEPQQGERSPALR